MKYPALKDPSRDLRLVLLRSVQFVQKSGCYFNGKPIEIICELHSFSPEETPEYFALSYPWKGEYFYNPISRYVLLNGIIAKIGENAAAALWTLRPESADIYIWVDALCIDQKDEKEMDLQIKRMHEIYSQAARTKVWLGMVGGYLDTDNMMESIRDVATKAIETGFYDALQAMRAAAERGENSEARLWQDRVNASVVQIRDNTEGPFGFAYGFVDFQDMYYWNRIWILQEVALSPHLDFLYGITRESLSLEQIQAAAALFRFGLDRATSGQVMTGGFDFSKKGLRSFRLTKFGIPLPTGPSSSPMAAVLDLRDRYQVTPKDGLSLMGLLAMVYADHDETRFTEPKDTVFALLSLATDAAQFRDRLHYTMSLEEIFCETARVILEDGQIDLLAYCALSPSESELKVPDRLGPSWAPDWASFVPRPVCGSPLKTAFGASGGGPFPGMPVRDSRKPQQLALHGMFVDTIESAGSCFYWPEYANERLDYCNAELQLAYMHQILGFCAQSREKRSETQSEDLSAIYATPVVGRLVSSQGTLLNRDKDRQYFIKGWLDLQTYFREHVEREGRESESPVLSEELIAYFQSMTNSYGSSPFLSVEGYVGVAVGVQPGDQIYLLAGAKFPYILREMKDETSTDRFEVVGAAYVHGIMYGEFLQGDQATGWSEVILT